MPREKFQTLTEQMFYILICLQNECCGIDIMEMVKKMTDGRVNVGPGTLYNLLEQFVDAGMIRETKCEGRRRSYLLTDAGRAALDNEYKRLQRQADDYKRLMGGVRYDANKTEANAFAAILLAPKDRLDEQTDVYNLSYKNISVQTVLKIMDIFATFC